MAADNEAREGGSLVSKRVRDVLEGTGESWTRRMFELGRRLRAQGGGPVFDLSLGNPSLEPPPAFVAALRELVEDPTPGRHRYMTNAGFPEVRAFVAERESARFGLAIDADDVVLSVGAAGGLAIVLRALTDPGDEVVVPAPYFSEYDHYCRHADVRLVAAETGDDFALDVEAIERVLSPRTRIVLLNSPNNPTGAIYGARDLSRLADVLTGHATQDGRPPVLVEDAPYRDLVYDGSVPASAMTVYPHTIHVTSHSKDLGLAGERIGYAVISPRLADRRTVARALAYCNRTLGFVNAPALMQRVLPKVLGRPDGRVDVGVYARRARRLRAGLVGLGFAVPEPRAGFFLFPRLPDAVVARTPEGQAADVAFAERLVARRCIVVPGSAFGVENHLRLSVATDDAAIDGALAAIEAELATR